MGWRVGIDTGGTFTDLVAVRGKDLRIVKVPSTPPDFETGIVNSIISAGLKLDEIDEIAHGTTVATNAIITGETGSTALLTTYGFRDVLQLGRHNRGEPFDIMWDPPAPVVRIPVMRNLPTKSSLRCARTPSSVTLLSFFGSHLNLNARRRRLSTRR